MPFISNSLSDVAVVFLMFLLVKSEDVAYAFIVFPIKKKKRSGGRQILSAFGCICHSLNVCLLTIKFRLDCLTSIIQERCLSQNTGQLSASSVLSASSAKPSNSKSSSARIDMRLKGCMPKIHCILDLTWSLSYKLVGISITEYFLLISPLCLPQMCFFFFCLAFPIFPSSPLPFTFFSFGYNKKCSSPIQT